MVEHITRNPIQAIFTTPLKQHNTIYHALITIFELAQFVSICTNLYWL